MGVFLNLMEIINNLLYGTGAHIPNPPSIESIPVDLKPIHVKEEIIEVSKNVDVDSPIILVQKPSLFRQMIPSFPNAKPFQRAMLDRSLAIGRNIYKVKNKPSITELYHYPYKNNESLLKSVKLDRCQVHNLEVKDRYIRSQTFSSPINVNVEIQNRNVPGQVEVLNSQAANFAEELLETVDKELQASIAQNADYREEFLDIAEDEWQALLDQSAKAKADDQSHNSDSDEAPDPVKDPVGAYLYKLYKNPISQVPFHKRVK